MFGFEFIFYLIWQLITFPFRFIWSLNPFIRIKDNKLIEQFYDFLDELKHFIIFMNKGPVEIKQYVIQNVRPRETHVELSYLSSKFSEQRVIRFITKIEEKKFSYFSGGRSGGGLQYFDKKNINFDEIAKRAYLSIELSSLDKSNNYYKEYDRWKEEYIKPLFAQYNIKENFYYFRRALILITHNEEHGRYKKAFDDLKKVFKTDNAVFSFVKDVKNAYSVKTVLDKLV